jgi:pyruvate/2-oxoglutarate dehydrogenase complex dihydrolipoamide dehydrogenase (E3) component
MERVQRVIRAVEPHDSVERYTALGVECIRGEARITSPWTVESTASVTSPRARSSSPPARGRSCRRFPASKRDACLTSDNRLGAARAAAALVVLGGGPVGCELAQAFARLGSQVTQVEMLPRLLAREDPDVSELVRARVRGRRASTCARAPRGALRRGRTARLRARRTEKRVDFDALLCALGACRTPRATGSRSSASR